VHNRDCGDPLRIAPGVVVGEQHHFELLAFRSVKMWPNRASTPAPPTAVRPCSRPRAVRVGQDPPRGVRRIPSRRRREGAGEEVISGAGIRLRELFSSGVERGGVRRRQPLQGELETLDEASFDAVGSPVDAVSPNRVVNASVPFVPRTRGADDSQNDGKDDSVNSAGAASAIFVNMRSSSGSGIHSP